MFNQIKHLKDLRDQAKKLQNNLAEQTVTVERDGVTLVMDGNQEIKSLSIPADKLSADLEKIIPRLVNEANDQVKRIMAQTMQNMGGFDLPGLQ